MGHWTPGVDDLLLKFIEEGVVLLGLALPFFAISRFSLLVLQFVLHLIILLFSFDKALRLSENNLHKRELLLAFE